MLHSPCAIPGSGATFFAEKASEPSFVYEHFLLMLIVDIE